MGNSIAFKAPSSPVEGLKSNLGTMGPVENKRALNDLVQNISLKHWDWEIPCSSSFYLDKYKELYTELEDHICNILPDSWLRQEAGEHLEDLFHGMCIYFIKYGSEYIGYYEYKVYPIARRVHICSFYIKEKYRHTGIGTLVIKKLASEAKACKFKTFTLNVQDDNTAARAFYKKLGFNGFGNFQKLVL